MKKLLLLSALAVFATGAAFAQNYMVINSETIFKSLDEYTKAVAHIDSLARTYQQNIDEGYKKIEEQYNLYMQQKASLSQTQQQQRENTIINNEKRIAEYQEAAFGEEGTIVKMRAEQLEPIQKKVMATIGDYAKKNGFSLALDLATNPIVVYYDPALDRTQQIIALLK